MVRIEGVNVALKFRELSRFEELRVNIELRFKINYSIEGF